MSEQLLFIDIDRIELHPVVSSWRVSYEDVQDLAFDIKRNGILEPVLVRPLGDGNYQLLAGNRRYHAARLAGLKQIPARILHVDDSKALEIALSENLHRRDLNPVELARAFKSLVDQGYKVEEIARMFGKSRPWVSNHIRILGLPEYVLEKIASRELSVDHGIALLKLTSYPEKLKKVFDWIFDESTQKIYEGIPTVKALRNTVDATLKVITNEELKKSWGFYPYYLCNSCSHWDRLTITKDKYEKDGYKCPECGSADLTIGDFDKVWIDKVWNHRWGGPSNEDPESDEDPEGSQEQQVQEIKEEVKEVKIEHDIALDVFVKYVIDTLKEHAEISEFEVFPRWDGSTVIYITFKKTDKSAIPSFTVGKRIIKLASSREEDERMLRNLLGRVKNGK